MTGGWFTAAATTIGSVHIRDGTPGQDSFQTYDGDGLAVIAVADGHGHAAHFRSGVGSRLAVAAAVDLLTEVGPDLSSVADAEEVLRETAGPRLVARWQQAVRHHVEANPFGEDDWLPSDGDVLRPYGTTIVAMAATESVLAVLQIGDGEAVVVLRDGTVMKPLPIDPDLDGALTTSLCQPDPLRSFRSAALDTSEGQVVLGFVCTDGFSAPRVDVHGWWPQVGRELVQHARQHGAAWIEEKLPSWLEEPAEYGGDDTTLAIIGNERALAETVPV